MVSRKILSVILVMFFFILAPTVEAAPSSVYLHDSMNNYYPFFAFQDGNNLMIAERTGEFSVDITSSVNVGSEEQIANPADYDGDGKLEVPIRNQNKYIIYYKFPGLTEDFSVTEKPKKGAQFLADDIDNDNVTELVFADANANNKLKYINNPSGSYTLNLLVNSDAKAKGPVDIGDFNKDGVKEVLYHPKSSSQKIKYMNMTGGTEGSIHENARLVPYPTSDFLLTNLTEGQLRFGIGHKDGSDGPNLGFFIKGEAYPQSKNLPGISDTETTSSMDGGTSVYWSENKPAVYIGADSNGKAALCEGDTTVTCQRIDDSGASSFGLKAARATIPPFTKEPQLNTSTVEPGESIKVSFNATDREGYTDIQDHTALIKLYKPDGTLHSTKGAENIGGGNGLPGQNLNGRYVPSDGATKSFSTARKIPSNAPTGTWNVTVQVQDEKMTGTKNWTTFTVEKALVEKNVSESLSVGRKDTSRQTSLGKSQITGLIMGSQGFTEASTFRVLPESLGFLSGKGRIQSLSKNLMTGMAFSRSGNGFKTVFSTLGSEISASSEVFDIYSALRGFDPVFGFSDSASDKAFFSESIDQSYGLDGVVSGQSVFLRLDPLSLTVDFGGNRSSDVARSFSVGLEAGSSPLTGLAFGRSFDPVFSFSGIDTDRSDALFSRSSKQGLGFSETLTRTLGSTYFKTLSTVFDFSSSPVRSGVDLSVSLASALDLGTDGSRGSIYARSFDSIISSSADSLIGQYLFRDFFMDYIADSGELRAQNVSRATDNSITGSFTSSRSSNLGRLLSGSIAQTLGLSRSDAFFERSSSQSILISDVFEGERTFGRAMSFSYRFVSSPVESTAGYFRVLSSELFLDTAGDSSVMFERQESTGIRPNSTLSRGISGSRYLSTALMPGLTVEVFDGVMIALDQTLGIGSASSDLFESSRGQDTSLEASSDYSSGVSFFRSFSQSVGFNLGLGDLIDFVLEFFREDPDGGGNGDGDSNGGNNGDGNDGGPTSSLGGDNKNVPVSEGNSSEEENSTSNSTVEENGGDEDIVKIIEASLRESEVSDNEVAELTDNITCVDRGQQVVIDISDETGRGNLSNGSETASTLEKRDLIRVNTVKFEAQRSEEDPDISLNTFDEVRELGLDIEDKNVYEATEVSTNFDTTDASLVYEVKKKFLITNNATVDEIVVSRWENRSKLGELKTKLLNESEDAYTIRAISPKGFSVFVVSLKSSGQQIDEKPEEESFISLPEVSPGTISLLLLISTVLLLRREIVIKTFTSDLKVKKARLKASMFFLKLRKRFDLRKEREAGKKEYGLAEEVESLENKVEVMQYKKEKQSDEIERMEDIYKRLRYECTLLAERIKEAT